MLKRNIILIFGVLVAFLFILAPESNAAFTVNGETYPDLPTQFIDNKDVSHEFTTFDYFIYTTDSDNKTYLCLFALNDAEVTSNFYMDGKSLTYKLSKKLTGWNFSKWLYYLEEDGTWSDENRNHWNAGDFSLDKTGHGHGTITFLASSKDIYTDSSMSTVFFQETPISNFHLHQIVGETVKQEIPKMASKIIQAMKVIVVFSISCLIFFLLLATFSRVLSVFRVKS